MMHQTSEFKWVGFDGFDAIELPYRGRELSMIILLPQKKDGLKILEGRFSRKILNQWTEKLRQSTEVKVAVSLPKFTSTSEFELSKTLGKMGMSDAFNDHADFSGMTGNADLKIGKVIHKAFY